jgi:transposase
MPPIRHTTLQLVQNQYDTPSQHPNVTQRSRRCQLAPHERVRLVELKAIGWSYTEIHERYPYIPIGTIKTTVARAEKRGPTQAALPRSGTPKKLDETDRLRILEAISENPRIKYDALLALVNFKCGRATIWRLLQGENKRKWLQLQRPELTDQQARQRLAWAHRVQDYDSEKWKKIFWSDETTIERGKGGRREWTFTPRNRQIAERDVQQVPCHKSVKQMFWAAFSGTGRRSGLIPLFGDPNSPNGGVNRFVILELYQRVLPTLLSGVEGAVFQQDNASVHTAHIVRDWIADQDYEIMKWPPYSPDLSPIENLWSLLKAKIYELHPEIRGMPNNDDTLQFIIGVAQIAWSMIDIAILENLAITMPHRVQQVIDNDGWYTSY